MMNRATFRAESIYIQRVRHWFTVEKYGWPQVVQNQRRVTLPPELHTACSGLQQLPRTPEDAGRNNREGEAPAEPSVARRLWLDRSLALPEIGPVQATSGATC